MTAGTAIVLGAAGFVGRHVCRELASQGYRVHGVGHGAWTSPEWKAWGLSQWLGADISVGSLDECTAGRSPGVLVHCAGSGAVSHSFTQPFEDFHRSVSSTAAVLEFARIHASSNPAVVLVSSAAVYGDHGQVDLSESAPRAPISPYGFSRVASENLCEVYSRFFGVKTTIVRLFSVYGDGLRKQLLWDALNKFSRGECAFFGTGRELRDWIHVEDAARLLCLAAKRSGQMLASYNGGHTKATTGEILGLLAGHAGFAQSPHFNGELLPGNPARLTADSQRAHLELNWSPSIEIESGLARYVHWFEAQQRS